MVAAPPATRPAVDRRWIALVVIAVAQLMVALDATVVNIALPTAQHALHFSDADRQWVVTAYTASVAGLLLLGGRVADLLGRRRAFLAGLFGFAAASALAGAAPDFAALVAGRAVQGAFAALLAPTAMSLIAVSFPAPRERAKAFGVYGAVASSGGAAGLLLGGALTQYLDWRWCLYVNVAVAAVAFVAGRAVLPNVPVQGRAQVDVLSGILATGGLAAVVYACSQAVPHGWSSARVVVAGLVGLAALAAFLRRQARHRTPLLPLYVVANRPRAGAYLAVAAAVVGTFGTFLMLTYHFQVVLHYSPLRAGLAFLPLTVTVSASAYALASRLLPHVPPRALVVPGLLVASAGLLLLAQLTPSSGYLSLILPAQLLLGLGIGCVFTPCLAVATSRIEPRDAGVAAAVANTSMQVGGSVGTAVLNTVAITATRGFRGAPVAALVHGYAVAASVSAGVLVAAALAALVLVDIHRATH
jgi:EmrB/QacA subfamily drug resistance transporter